MTKGMELPINMIVVVLIAVLVLTTIGIFLTSSFGTNANTIQWESLRGSACNTLRYQGNCANTGLQTSTDTNGAPIKISQVCDHLGSVGDEACKRMCGCS